MSKQVAEPGAAIAGSGDGDVEVVMLVFLLLGMVKLVLE